MAIAAHSIAAPAAATPPLALVSVTPANDTAPSWTADPRAAKLLASCVALPPVYAEHRSRYGNSVDRWNAHAGYRVEALEAIRMEIGDRLMRAYHQHAESAYEPFRQWCEQPNATDAISAALASNAGA